MVLRALTVLFAALVTACAGAAGFNDAPHTGQVVILISAAIFSGAFQALTFKKTQHSV